MPASVKTSTPTWFFGPPHGKGPSAGSLHVLSLGQEGEIILGFEDIPITDGPGVDVLVFENAFPGWPELGVVSVSEDGEEWHEWPCDTSNSDAQFPVVPEFPVCCRIPTTAFHLRILKPQEVTVLIWQT